MEPEPIHPPVLQMEPVAQPTMPMPMAMPLPPLNPHNPPGKYSILPSTMHATLFQICFKYLSLFSGGSQSHIISPCFDTSV